VQFADIRFLTLSEFADFGVDFDDVQASQGFRPQNRWRKSESTHCLSFRMLHPAG
jgi:hypothetical protein